MTYVYEFGKIVLKTKTPQIQFMRTTLKDTQISLRFSGEILEAMRSAAKSENISLSDFLVKLFQERDKNLAVDARLEALERAVFQQSQAA